jgi:hypothetical protein
MNLVVRNEPVVMIFAAVIIVVAGVSMPLSAPGSWRGRMP